jgi:hypothetical protein
MAENIQSPGYNLRKDKLASQASDHIYPELLLENLEPYQGFFHE